MLQGRRGSPAGYLILSSYFTAGHSVGGQEFREGQGVFTPGGEFRGRQKS